MFRKVMAVAALGIVAILAVPAVANAVDYTSSSNITVTGANGVALADVGAGDSVDITFIGAVFEDGETVSATVDGFGTPTLSTLKAAPFTLTKIAVLNVPTAFRMNLPTNAEGSYTVTATGLTSGATGSATVTVVPADAGAGSGTNSSSDGLAKTGASVPMLLIWSIVGILALGAALVAVRVAVRRQRASA
jgi:hypothetical protein